MPRCRGLYLTTIDGSAAKGDLDLSIASGRALNDVKLGEGDDVIRAWSISATASIDGGAGKTILCLRALTIITPLPPRKSRPLHWRTPTHHP